MSWDTLAWARRQRTGSPGRKAVLMVLAEHADEADSCFPSQATLADATEQSVRTVRGQLADMEAAGLIRRQARGRLDGGRTSDRYYLLVHPTPPAGFAGAPGNLEGVSGNPLPGPPGNGLPDNYQCEPPVEPPSEPMRDEDAGIGAAWFEEFWHAYPRKDDKGAARRKFQAPLSKVRGSAARRALAEAIVAGAERYAADPNRVPEFTKLPATWLRAEGWTNGPLPARTDRGKPTAVHPYGHAQDDPQRSQPAGLVEL